MAKAPRKSRTKAKISRPRSKVRSHFFGGLVALGDIIQGRNPIDRIKRQPKRKIREYQDRLSGRTPIATPFGYYTI